MQTRPRSGSSSFPSGFCGLAVFCHWSLAMGHLNRLFPPEFRVHAAWPAGILSGIRGSVFTRSGQRLPPNTKTAQRTQMCPHKTASFLRLFWPLFDAKAPVVLACQPLNKCTLSASRNFQFSIPNLQFPRLSASSFPVPAISKSQPLLHTLLADTPLAIRNSLAPTHGGSEGSVPENRNKV